MLRLMLRSCATLRRFGCACLRLSSPSCLRSRSALRHFRDDARVLAQAQEQADHAVLLRTRLVAPEGIADAGVFFFRADDGIRDATVTGVQTCALPISRDPKPMTTIVSSGAVVCVWDPVA